MKIILLLLLCCSSLYADLTKDDILKIEKKPHVEEALSIPLQIFTEGREFKVTATTLYAKEDKYKNKLEATVNRKVIDKNTIYVSYLMPGMDEPFRTVIKHDSEMGVYLKYMMTPDLQLRKLRGVSIDESRSVHWSMISPKETTVNVETYYDDKFIAKEVFLDENGEIQLIIEFRALKSK